MSVRAKFVVETATPASPTTGEGGGSVVLRPVTSGSAENDSFFKWTPAGQIVMGTINPDAFAEFTVGKPFYIDFTLADVDDPGADAAARRADEFPGSEAHSVFPISPTTGA